jgi:hypothetical protein
VYPAFVVTEISSKYLQETAIESIYSSRFADLKPSIEVYYHFVNDALKHVIGAKIDDRNVIDQGVFEVIYDNGVKIIINYRETAYVYDDIEIAPKNYVVVQQG